MERDTIYFKVFTRTAVQGEYPDGIAYSVHFAYSMDGEEYIPFNKNYGVLFPKATITEQNTISPKGIKNPRIFEIESGLWGICGERIQANGESDSLSQGKLLLWKTEDFIHFEDEEWTTEEEISVWNPAISIALNADIATKAITYWTPVVNTGVEVPARVEVADAKQLSKIKVKAIYNDGSVVEKNVDWDIRGIDFGVPGIYELNGTIRHKKYQFPLAKGYGDPVLLKYENKWYFVATNDNLDDIGIYVREADDVEGLFEEGVVEHLILPYDKERSLIQTFWAPEFHWIGGELYILFAVSGEQWGPQCHYMKFKKGGSIIEEESWENPVRIQRADGSWLAQGAITLDMTYIKVDSGSYYVWSYRENIGTPLDSGSMLYIASVDEKEPWKLTSEPVLLTRPLYGWENVEGTINNEGPYAFVKDGKVYLTYSGGAANGYTYALGLLTADGKNNLLDINAWKKSNTAVLSYYSVDGEFGPGHNSFFISEEGELMIAYHGETDIKDHLRCDGIRRVHFRKEGTPYFGMSSDEDLKEEYAKIKLQLEVIAD